MPQRINPARAEMIRSRCAQLRPRPDELARVFYGSLFEHAPETRALFPPNVPPQHSRLLPALLHVLQMVDRPIELAPFLAQLGRDHRKLGISGKHYEAVRDALLAALAHTCADDWTADEADAWADAYAILSGRMLSAARAARSPASWLARVVEHRRLGHDLALVTVQALEPIPYLAGQYVTVETPQRPRIWRPLSPANRPRPDGLLQFHVRAVEGGLVSPALVAATRVDDTWRIGPPLGQLPLVLDSPRDLLMIAGGTGAAPINALVAELASRAVRPRTHVFLGGRTRDDLYTAHSMSELSSISPWLDVIPVLEHPYGRTERGTVADAVIRHGPWHDCDVVVSGSPAMLRETIRRLNAAGVPLDRIHHDPLVTLLDGNSNRPRRLRRYPY